MRIPTGMRRVTITASRKSFIQYTCCKCGKTSLYEYVLKQAAAGGYHALQSDQSKGRVEDKISANASSHLDKQDAALFNAINTAHDYQMVQQAVKCPQCGELQPWSKIPCKWVKSAAFWYWVTGLFFLGLFAALTLTSSNPHPSFDILLAISAAVLVLPPLIRGIRRKKALDRVRSAVFVPPVYYNRQNIGQLLNQNQAGR